MITIDIESAKFNAVFRAGNLPQIDPTSPAFLLRLGGVPIRASVSAKAARKLAAHPGGAALQGRLIVQGGGLVLLDGGFQFLDVAPSKATTPTAPTDATAGGPA